MHAIEAARQFFTFLDSKDASFLFKSCHSRQERLESADLSTMEEAKNTARAIVHIGYDGRVHKYFKGPQARERYENEVRVLRFLEAHGCPFVPKIVEDDEDKLYLVTTSCGSRVDRMSDEKKEQIFVELEQYGVRHDDAEVRNITYSAQLGRFCVIDFEFATILAPGYPSSPRMESVADRSQWQGEQGEQGEQGSRGSRGSRGKR
jgi:predicted Ser/Thr protein kinase